MLAAVTMTSENHKNPGMDLIQLQSDSSPKANRSEEGIIVYRRTPYDSIDRRGGASENRHDKHLSCLSII